MAFLTQAANRGSVVTGPYEIDNSLKFEPENSETIRDAHNTEGNRRELTISFWCKITDLGDDASHRMPFTAGARQARIWFDASDQLTIQLQDAPGYLVKTNRKFRDPAAWYHFVIAIDTTQATDSNRIKLWVNGEQQTSWATTQWPPQNFEGYFNDASSHHISDPGYYFAGYMADFFFIDDQVLQATDFGEYDEDSGIWIAKNYSSGFSGQSFYLEFGNSSDLLERSDGLSNGVSLSSTNIAAIDQATDTPTNNFCTINPLFDNAFALWSLTEGGTRGPNTNENNGSVGTFAVDSGKWYWEGVTTSYSGTQYWRWGITRVDVAQGLSADPSSDAMSGWYSAENTFHTQTSTTASSVVYNTGITSYTAGDIWSISLNCDVSPYTMTFRINNSVAGTTSNNTDRSVGTYASADAVMPLFMLGSSSSDNTWHNFGNPFLAALSGGNSDANGYGDFKYAPPSGYYALCSKNLAEFG